jgi:hypothetical protein
MRSAPRANRISDSSRETTLGKNSITRGSAFIAAYASEVVVAPGADAQPVRAQLGLLGHARSLRGHRRASIERHAGGITVDGDVGVAAR